MFGIEKCVNTTFIAAGKKGRKQSWFQFSSMVLNEQEYHRKMDLKRVFAVHSLCQLLWWCNVL
jgi:hypothetical protein